MKYKLLVVTKTLDDLINNKKLSDIKLFFDNAPTYKLIEDYENNDLENNFNRVISRLKPYDISKYCVWAALDEKNDLYYCVKVDEDVIIKYIANLSDGITFTNKELKILKLYNLYTVNLLIETINLKTSNHLANNWKLTEKEVEEFKAKLERLIS